MAARNREIRPVGAWAQPGAAYSKFDTMESASKEETRLLHLQTQKVTHLQRFQDEVKLRVQAISKMKRQQELNISLTAVLNEQNVISKSSTAAGKSVLKRNCCTLRPQRGLTISQGIDCQMKAEFLDHFLHYTNQVQMLCTYARESLAKRQVIMDDFDHDEPPADVKNKESTLLLFEDGCCSCLPALSEDKTAIADDATFGIINGTGIDHVSNVPNEQHGHQCKEAHIPSQQLRAVYRRLFMDIEREQVKDNIHQKEHCIKMAIFKKAKESERKRMEQLTFQSNESVLAVSDQAKEESEIIKSIQKEILHLGLDEQTKWKQKNKEIERFLNTLKRRLKEKMDKQNIALPILCSCGTSVWDISPETCANNCAFYQNPKGYAKALQSLVLSCEAM